MASGSGKIFISYRRDDSGPTAGRIADRLVARFGEDHVFMDVDSILPGRDFAAAIEAAVGSCDVVLAIIGRTWLTMEDEYRRRRLDDPGDFVALEITAGLSRDIPVIPVLLDGTPQLRGDTLPEPLAALARRQSVRLAHESFKVDCATLISALERVLAEQPPELPDEAAALRHRAHAHLESGRLEEARQDLDRSLQLDPNDHWALVRRGGLFIDLGQAGNALPDLEHALQIVPDDAWAISCRATALMELGRNDEALHDFDVALRMGLDGVHPRCGRGMAALNLGRIGEALRDLEAAVRMEPGSAYALRCRGHAYATARRFPEALRDFDRSLAVEPGHTWTLDRRAEALQAMGRDGTGEPAPPVHSSAHQVHGQHADAILEAVRALEKDHGDVEAQRRLDWLTSEEGMRGGMS